jgi:hypothetical protein
MSTGASKVTGFPLSKDFDNSLLKFNFQLHLAQLEMIQSSFSFDLWASKVTKSFANPSGFGTYLVTTIQEKHNKKLSLIVAYIAYKHWD